MNLACKECAQHKKSRVGLDFGNVIPSETLEHKDIMVVFPGISKETAQSGSLYSNSASKEKYLSWLKSANIDSSNVYFTTLVKCIISDPKKPPAKPQKTKCFNLYLAKEIEKIKPKVIITVGDMTSRYFIKGFKKLEQCVGYSFSSEASGDAKLLPMYSLTKVETTREYSKERKAVDHALGKLTGLLNTTLGKDDIVVSRDYNDLDKLKKVVSVDLETTGLNPRHDAILTLGLSDGTTTLSFDIGYGDIDYDRVYECLSTRKLVFQNGGFDLGFFKVEGYDYDKNYYLDTRALQYLLDPKSTNSLGFLCEKHFGVNLKIDIDRANLSEADIEVRRTYCGYDAYYTFKLLIVLLKQIKEKNLERSALLRTKAIIVAYNLQLNGLKLDAFNAKQIKADVFQKKFDAEEAFKKAFKLDEDFNMNSPKQLGDLFYNKLKIPVKYTTGSGAPACNEQAIRNICNRRKKAKSLLDFREHKGELEKAELYLKSIEDDGRIRSSFDAFAPQSLRLMSRKPNLQNVTKGSDLQNLFISEDGYTYCYYDYAALEFRLWVAIALDESGAEFIRDETKDIHRFIASKLLIKNESAITKSEREDVKSVVYGSLYGDTPEGIAWKKEVDLEVAKKAQRIFFNICRKGLLWTKQIERFALENAYVATPFGSRTYLPEIRTANKQKQRHLLNVAKNFPIQSWGAELGILGCYNILNKIKELKLDARLVHQIHDAYIFEVLDSQLEQFIPIMKHEAEHPCELFIPLSAEVKTGKKWGSLEE